MTPSNWDRAKAALNLTRDKQMARCPCHADSTASLSVARKGDDVVLHCFAGCDWRDLRHALGLTFTPAPNTPQREKPSPVPHRRIIREHVYRNYAGDPIAIKRRWAPDKYFDWVHLGQDGEWRPKLAPNTSQADLPLYRVVEAAGMARAGASVFLVEGEKDCDTLHALGLAAVSNPEGASGAASAYDVTRFVGVFPPNTPLIVLPDNDAPGRTHAAKLADALAPTFPIFLLILPNLGEKQDVSDWVEQERARGREDSLIRADLEYRAIHAMPHVPSADVAPNGRLISPNVDPDDIAERAAVLADANGWPMADCDRIARHQVAARVERQRASLTPAERLALGATDPALAAIYRELASLRA